MPNSSLTPAEWQLCRLAYNQEQTVLLVALPGKTAVFTRQMDLLDVLPADALSPDFIPKALERHKAAALLRDLNDREFAAQLRRTRIAEDRSGPSIPRPKSQAIEIDLELDL